LRSGRSHRPPNGPANQLRAGTTHQSNSGAAAAAPNRFLGRKRMQPPWHRTDA